MSEKRFKRFKIKLSIVVSFYVTSDPASNNLVLMQATIIAKKRRKGWNVKTGNKHFAVESCFKCFSFGVKRS